jgi:hypothetical protein
MRIIYQTYQYDVDRPEGPFKYIESGIISALKSLGHNVLVYSSKDSLLLQRELERFKPNVFIGYVRGDSRFNYGPNFWLNDTFIEFLKTRKNNSDLRVICFTHP